VTLDELLQAREDLIAEIVGKMRIGTGASSSRSSAASLTGLCSICPM